MKALRSIDTRSREPLHLQARRILADAICKGAFPHEQPLPDSREIAARINASLVTTRRAIARLVREGWIRRDGPVFTIAVSDYDRTMQAAPLPCLATNLGPAHKWSFEGVREYAMSGTATANRGI
jgi:DNA-binding transcriptional regulator YhcF (GntR family)